jgi:hypothetical protein
MALICLHQQASARQKAIPYAFSTDQCYFFPSDAGAGGDGSPLQENAANGKQAKRTGPELAGFGYFNRASFHE